MVGDRESWGTLGPAPTLWPPPCRLGMEEWYPGEDVPCATAASSPATSSGCRSTATLTPSPRTTEDIPRLRDFDSPRLPR